MERRPAGFYIAAAGVAALILGSLGPWAKITLTGSSVSGIDGSNDGWILLVLGTIVGLMLWKQSQRNWRGVLIVGILATAAAGYDRTHVDHIAGRSSGLLVVGWGLNLVLVGAIAVLISAFVLRREGADAAGEAEDAGPNEPADDLVCVACGASTNHGDRFCAHCGAEFENATEFAPPTPST